MRIELTHVAFATLIGFTMNAEGATLSGRLVADHLGTAAASADVRAFRIGTAGLIAELETDAEGRFMAEGLPSGEYRIEVSKANHIPSSVRVTLSDGAPSNLLLRLVRCGSISGRLLDGNGQPITGAQVLAMRSGTGVLQRESTAGRWANVDASGRYRLFNLPPGQYVLAAAYGATTSALGSTGSASSHPTAGSGVQFYPSNARPQPIPIAGGEDIRNVEFSVLTTNLYSVSGKVEAAPGPNPRGRFWLALAMTDQPAIAVAATTANEDGSFQFTGIPSGSYELLASGPSTARSSRGAELPDNAQFGRTRVTVGSQNVDGLVLATSPGRSVAFVLQTPPGTCPASGQMRLSSMEDWGANVERQSPVSVAQTQTVARLAPARYRISVSGLGDTCFVPEGTVLDLAAPRDAGPVAIEAVAAGRIAGAVSGADPARPVAVVLTEVSDGNEPIQLTSLDQDSRFAFTQLRPGRYRVAAKFREGAGSRWIDTAATGVIVEVTGGRTHEITIPVRTDVP